MATSRSQGSSVPRLAWHAILALLPPAFAQVALAQGQWQCVDGAFTEPLPWLTPAAGQALEPSGPPTKIKAFVCNGDPPPVPKVTAFKIADGTRWFSPDPKVSPVDPLPSQDKSRVPYTGKLEFTPDLPDTITEAVTVKVWVVGEPPDNMPECGKIKTLAGFLTVEPHQECKDNPLTGKPTRDSKQLDLGPVIGKSLDEEFKKCVPSLQFAGLHLLDLKIQGSTEWACCDPDKCEPPGKLLTSLKSGQHRRNFEAKASIQGKNARTTYGTYLITAVPGYAPTAQTQGEGAVASLSVNWVEMTEKRCPCKRVTVEGESSVHVKIDIGGDARANIVEHNEVVAWQDAEVKGSTTLILSMSGIKCVIDEGEGHELCENEGKQAKDETSCLHDKVKNGVTELTATATFSPHKWVSGARKINFSCDFSQTIRLANKNCVNPSPTGGKPPPGKKTPPADEPLPLGVVSSNLSCYVGNPPPKPPPTRVLSR